MLAAHIKVSFPNLDRLCLHSIKNINKLKIMIKEHSKCLICDSERLKILRGYENYNLVKCTDCSFVFILAIPSELELQEYYGMYSYSQNPYLSPITIKRYNELLNYFEQYRHLNRILDVGCGVGFFLVEAKKRGWEVYGTEYSSAGIERCKEKNIFVKEGVLKASDFDYKQFDVITSFEVIEHINNPKDEMTEISKLLRSGGLLYVTTPNFNSISRNLLKDKWAMIHYPGHLSYYTPNTLKRLMVNFGFKKKKILTTGFSITYYKNSRGIAHEKIISSSSTDERLRRNIENKSYLKLAKTFLNRLLTLLGKGDSLKGYFVKK